jgi:hypothetical protein
MYKLVLGGYQTTIQNQVKFNLVFSQLPIGYQPCDIQWVDILVIRYEMILKMQFTNNQKKSNFLDIFQMLRLG